MHLVLLALALLGLLTPTARAQDPLQAAPTHFKVEFENERLRVLRLTGGPNEKIPTHEHPAYVTVYLTDTRARITVPGGRTRRVGRKAGETAWNDAQTHASEALSEKPYELVLVELKGKPVPGRRAAPPLDPVRLAPKHFRVELENERVRVLRLYEDPYVAIPMHEHPERVIVSLRDGHLKRILPDGNTVEIRHKAKEVSWRPPSKHASENLSEDPYEEISIEIKSSPGN